MSDHLLTLSGAAVQYNPPLTETSVQSKPAESLSFALPSTAPLIEVVYAQVSATCPSATTARLLTLFHGAGAVIELARSPLPAAIASTHRYAQCAPVFDRAEIENGRWTVPMLGEMYFKGGTEIVLRVEGCEFVEIVLGYRAYRF